jgi:very-short-patch-repair endonuclease
MYSYNQDLVKNAQTLRKNMTSEEKHLWYDFLRKLPVTVNRQKNIGNYIVDFYAAKAKIVIELDGSQHGEPENRDADEKRDRELSELGITVLRYSNKDIKQKFSVVCDDIMAKLGLTEEDFKRGEE